MSPEGMGKRGPKKIEKPKPQIAVDYENDSMYVVSLKHLMNEKGFSLEEAERAMRQEFAASIDGGAEHLESFNKAVESVKAEIAKKKNKKKTP